jgi:hypothetical protein
MSRVIIIKNKGGMNLFRAIQPQRACEISSAQPVNRPVIELKTHLKNGIETATGA